jgi:hypothetical protein
VAARRVVAFLCNNNGIGCPTACIGPIENKAEILALSNLKKRAGYGGKGGCAEANPMVAV